VLNQGQILSYVIHFASSTFDVSSQVIDVVKFKKYQNSDN